MRACVRVRVWICVRDTLLYAHTLAHKTHNKKHSFAHSTFDCLLCVLESVCFAVYLGVDLVLLWHFYLTMYTKTSQYTKIVWPRFVWLFTSVWVPHPRLHAWQNSIKNCTCSSWRVLFWIGKCWVRFKKDCIQSVVCACWCLSRWNRRRIDCTYALSLLGLPSLPSSQSSKSLIVRHIHKSWFMSFQVQSVLQLTDQVESGFPN